MMSKSDLSDNEPVLEWSPQKTVEKISPWVFNQGILKHLLDIIANKMTFIFEEFQLLFLKFKQTLTSLNYNLSNANKASGTAFYFQLGGINCVIIPEESKEVLSWLLFKSKVVPSLLNSLLSYMLRKFIFHLNSSSVFSEKAVVINNPQTDHPVNFVAGLELQLRFTDHEFQVHLLFSEETIAFFSRITDVGPVADYPVNLCLILIDATNIEELLESGTVLDLEIPISNVCYLELPNKQALHGELVSVNEKWAFRLKSADPFTVAHPSPGKAVLSVELFRVKANTASLSPNSILLSDSPVSPHAAVKLGNNFTRPATVGIYNERFALIMD